MTNITVVSALLWGGAPADIVRAAREQRIRLITSAALIAELEEVLAREKSPRASPRSGAPWQT